MADHASKPIEALCGALNDVERKHAPTRLYYAGDVALLKSAPQVAIVGSRKASAGALETARYLARDFARLGAVVMSGLAEGIDTAAHTATIDAGGKTIAVLGTPLTECYPVHNRALQQRIMREHLAVSQFPPRTPTQRKNFPMRNRTMALLSDATIIVEAADGGGSLHQGWEALRLGRPLFMLQAMLDEPALAWPREMMHYGAQVLTSKDAERIFFDFLPERGLGRTRELAL